MTRRKTLSKRLTILSRSGNLTQKQEHQVVAMADRARHLEADLEAARERETKIRALLADDGPEVSCGGYGVLSDGCYVRDLGLRVLAILEGTSEFEERLMAEMRKPLGPPAEQAAAGLRCTFAIEQMGRKLREQEKES